MNEVKRPLFFRIVAETKLGPIAGENTEKCLASLGYANIGDPELCLPDNQPDTDACTITTLAPSREAILAEYMASLLGVDVGKDIILLAELLEMHGYIITFTQVKGMIMATKGGTKTVMTTGMGGNLFCVKTKNPVAPIAVSFFSFSPGCACVMPFNGGLILNSNHRLLIRNLGDALEE